MSTPDQLSLFDVPPLPTPPRSPSIPAPRPGEHSKYSRLPVTAHRTCDECLIVAHERNLAGELAPIPEKARMRRALGGEVWHLCHGHYRVHVDEEAFKPMSMGGKR